MKNYKNLEMEIYILVEEANIWTFDINTVSGGASHGKTLFKLASLISVLFSR